MKEPSTQPSKGRTQLGSCCYRIKLMGMYET